MVSLISFSSRPHLPGCPQPGRSPVSSIVLVSSSGLPSTSYFDSQSVAAVACLPAHGGGFRASAPDGDREWHRRTRDHGLFSPQGARSPGLVSNGGLLCGCT
jgi:hypothetical protein